MIGATESKHHPSESCIALDQQLGWIYGIPIFGVRDLFFDSSYHETDKRPSPNTHYLSNTTVLTSKAEVLWDLGWQFLPKMMELFDELQDAIGTSYERAVLEKIFQNPKLWDTSLLALLQLTPILPQSC